MLEQQQPVADAPLPSLLGQLVLELPGRLVWDGPKTLDEQLPAVGEEERALVAGRGERERRGGGGEAPPARRFRPGEG